MGGVLFIDLLFYHITLLDIDEIWFIGSSMKIWWRWTEGRDHWYLGAITQCSPWGLGHSDMQKAIPFFFSSSFYFFTFLNISFLNQDHWTISGKMEYLINPCCSSVSIHLQAMPWPWKMSSIYLLGRNTGLAWKRLQIHLLPGLCAPATLAWNLHTALSMEAVNYEIEAMLAALLHRGPWGLSKGSSYLKFILLRWCSLIVKCMSLRSPCSTLNRTSVTILNNLSIFKTLLVSVIIWTENKNNICFIGFCEDST